MRTADLRTLRREAREQELSPAALARTFIEDGIDRARKRREKKGAGK